MRAELAANENDNENENFHPGNASLGPHLFKFRLSSVDKK